MNTDTISLSYLSIKYQVEYLYLKMLLYSSRHVDWITVFVFRQLVKQRHLFKSITLSNYSTDIIRCKALNNSLYSPLHICLSGRTYIESVTAYKLKDLFSHIITLVHFIRTTGVYKRSRLGILQVCSHIFSQQVPCKVYPHMQF